MNLLSNIKISGKIYTLVILAIAGIVSIAGVGNFQTGRVFESANYATVNTVPSFKAVGDIRAAFLKMRIATLNHVLNTDEARMVGFDREIAEQREIIAKNIAYYQDKLISNAEDKRQIDRVDTAIKEYYKGHDLTLKLSQQNKNVEAKANTEKTAPLASQVDEALKSIREFNEALAIENSAHANAVERNASLLSITITLLMIMLLGIVGWLIANRELSQPISLVAGNLEQLAQGQMQVMVAGIERRDEIGSMARSAQVFKEFVQKLDTQGWIKTHVTETSNALQQAEDLRALAQTAVSKIAAAVRAGHGAFYVADADGRYNLLASYGYRERKHLSNNYAVGEGLVGQAAMEKSPITLTAPKDYIRINSGLGEGPPACISVLPVIMGERVLGVLEMASFQAFSEREQALMDALLPVLATSLEILDRNLKTRELLVATQEQAERMEKQAAQMEEQQVEMEAQQAELLETENWFRSIIETAPDGMLVADGAGQIMLTNPELERIFGYETGELVGGTIEQLVPVNLRSMHEKMIQRFMVEGRNGPMGEGLGIAGQRKNGSTFPIAVSLSLLPPHGARGKCVSVSVRKIES